MKRVLRAFLGSALCLCLASAVALAAPSSNGAAHMKVGEFAVLMAKAMNLPAESVDAAVRSLQGANVRVAGGHDKDLVEGDLINLLSQIGINVTTSDPARKVTKDRAGEIVGAFSADFARAGAEVPVENGTGVAEGNPSNPNDDFNNGNGRGGKFKRKKKNSQTGSD